MKILDRLLGRKKVKEEPETEPDMEEAISVYDLDSIDGDDSFIELPDLPEPPPKRIISEDVKLKKRKKKTKKTTEKRSVKKMAGEIVYEYVQCDCEDWKNFLPQITKPMNEGKIKYTGKPFVYCPWCGYKRYRSNRGRK